jgi:hypothetical protein
VDALRAELTDHRERGAATSRFLRGANGPERDPRGPARRSRRLDDPPPAVGSPAPPDCAAAGDPPPG